MGFGGMETWAGIAFLVITCLVGGGVLFTLWRYRRKLWLDRSWPMRAFIAAAGLVMAPVTLIIVWLVGTVVVIEFRLLEPERDYLESVTGVDIPEGVSYEAWHDEIWLDGNYWLAFSVPRSELPGFFDRLPKMRAKSAPQLQQRLADMHSHWSDTAPTKGLVGRENGPAWRDVVIDQSDPDVAVIYIKATTI